MQRYHKNSTIENERIQKWQNSKMVEFKNGRNENDGIQSGIQNSRIKNWILPFLNSAISTKIRKFSFVHF